MTRIHTPTPEMEAGWNEWVQSRPPHVRAVAERFDPWSLYRIEGSGHRAMIHSFQEDDAGAVSMTVTVSAIYNALMFERLVFGINPNDLVPCEAPAPNEPLGALLTDPKDVEAYCATRRALGEGRTP